MPTFEIHARKNKQWRLDSIYDDQNLAVIAAELLMEGGFYGAVRVVEDVTGTDGKPAKKVVFQRKAGEAKSPAEPKAAKGKAAVMAAKGKAAVMAPSSHGPSIRPVRRKAQPAPDTGSEAAATKPAGKKRKKKGKSSAMVWIVILALGGIAIAGLAAWQFVKAYIATL